jgi:hypothetical protein
MAHLESCPKCKATFIKALKKEFGEVIEQWHSGWPCKIEDVIANPKINGLTAKSLKEIYKGLQDHRGHKMFVRTSKLPPSDYYVKSLNCLVEFDESQHFTAPRGHTLALYPKRLKLGFDRKKWVNKCNTLNRHDNDPAFRDEQRAWYDTLRDLLPGQFGMNPTIRIFAKDLVWCNESVESIRRMLKIKYFNNLLSNRSGGSMKTYYKKTIISNHPEYKQQKRFLLADSKKTGLYQDTNLRATAVEVMINPDGTLAVYRINRNFERNECNMSLRAIGQDLLGLKDPSVSQMLKFLVTPDMEVERIFNCIRYKYLDSLRHGKKIPGYYITSKCNELFKALSRLPFRGIKRFNLSKKYKQIKAKHGFPSNVYIDIDKEKAELEFIIQYIRNICFSNGVANNKKVKFYKELIAIKPGAHEIFMDVYNNFNHWEDYSSKPGSDPRNNVLRMLHNICRKNISIDISKVNNEIKIPSYLTYAPCNVTEGPFVFRKNLSTKYYKDLKVIKKKKDTKGFNSKFYYLDYYGEKDNLSSVKKLDDFLKSAAKFQKFL